MGKGSRGRSLGCHCFGESWEGTLRELKEYILFLTLFRELSYDQFIFS